MCATCLVLLLAACNPTAEATYTPPFIPVTFSIDSSWHISVTLGFKITNFLGAFSVDSGVTAGLSPDSTRVSIISAIDRTTQEVYEVHERGTMTLCINGQVAEQISTRSIVVTVFNAPSSVRLLPANATSCAFTSRSSAPASSPAPIARPGGHSVTVTVPAAADGGVPAGITTTAGGSYRITATGSAQYGDSSGDACLGYPITHPDGSRYLDGQDCGPRYDPGATLPTSPIGLLIWRIGDGPWQPAPASFTATAAGPLFLAYNDDPGQYQDNTGSYTATVTCSQGC